MPTRLAAAATAVVEAEVEDPWTTVVAQASFWWRGRALPVEHGDIGVRMIRCVPRQRRIEIIELHFLYTIK